MIEIKDVQLINGSKTTHLIESKKSQIVDGNNLTLFPAVIDSVQTWKDQSIPTLALQGGVTTFFDETPCQDFHSFSSRCHLITNALKTVQTPLRFFLCMDGRKNDPYLNKAQIIALSSPTDLFFDTQALQNLLSLAKKLELPVVVPTSLSKSSISKMIDLIKIHHTKVYLCQVQTKEQVKLIRSAKEKNLPIYAKTALSCLCSPSFSDQDYFLKAVQEQVIDCVGSDRLFQSHVILPCLFNMYHKQEMSLETIISLTSRRAQDIFPMPVIDDVVLVDLNKEKPLHSHPILKTIPLKGWPVYTIIKGAVFHVPTS